LSEPKLNKSSQGDSSPYHRPTAKRYSTQRANLTGSESPPHDTSYYYPPPSYPYYYSQPYLSEPYPSPYPYYPYSYPIQPSYYPYDGQWSPEVYYPPPPYESTYEYNEKEYDKEKKSTVKELTPSELKATASEFIPSSKTLNSLAKEFVPSIQLDDEQSLNKTGHIESDQTSATSNKPKSSKPPRGPKSKFEKKKNNEPLIPQTSVHS